jgi:hypothetical protein
MNYDQFLDDYDIQILNDENLKLKKKKIFFLILKKIFTCWTTN